VIRTDLVRRLASTAVLLPLLVALLSQGLAPHFHDSVTGSETVKTECEVCRTANVNRIAAPAGLPFDLDPEAGPSLWAHADDSPTIAIRIVGAAPPRAPPL
jgi:hypothetical protein